MSEPLRVMLVGASGLVGRSVLAEAVGRGAVRLVGLSRREVPLPDGSRLEVMLAPVEGWAQAIAAIAPKHVICALGTTIARQGGDRAAFAAIDRDLVLQVARDAFAAGAQRFTVISSVGADRHAKNFYLHTKGEMEEQLGRIGFARLDILRPGLLRGKRIDDSRLLERVGMGLAPLMDLFLHGQRRKYRPVRAADVAAAALYCTQERARGKFVHEHDQIVRMAGRWRGGA